MGAKLTFKYDREGDILYINKRPPYPEQESEELGDEIIARLNPETKEIESLEVLRRHWGLAFQSCVSSLLERSPSLKVTNASSW